VHVFTDIEVNYGIVCPITATLTPAAAYISWANPTITVNNAGISQPADFGSHPFVLTVNSANWANNNVLPVQYNFNVIITCTVSSLSVTQQPSNVNPHILNATPF
jgi:hypothetical protein